MCFEFLYSFCLKTFLILRRIQRDAINVYWPSCQVILFRFYWYLHFRDRFSYIFQILNFTRIRPVGAEFFHADGQTTDLTMLKNSLSKFCEGAQKKP